MNQGVQMKLNLKTVLLKQINKLKSPAFLLLVFIILAFVLAILEPAIRAKFLDIIEIGVKFLCQKQF